jgi:hypothetical protein
MFMTSLPVRNGDAMVNVTVNGSTADELGLNATLISGFHQGPANLGGKQNRQGTYLTMMSDDGLVFGIINSTRRRPNHHLLRDVALVRAAR